MSTPPAAPGEPNDAASGRTYAPDFLLEMFRNPLDAGYADAAERRARLGPPPRRARSIGFTVRMVTLVATGVLLAVAYQQTVAAQPESSKVRDGLISDVRAGQTEADTMQRQANALRDQVAALRDAALAGTDIRAYRQLETGTGFGAVTGDGVVIRMSDGPQPVDPVTNQPVGKNLGQVFDSDLQMVANELWRDGAEAISINGQRLTATSTIRLAGSAILVDFVPLTQPYQLAAIGPATLRDAFADSATGHEYQRVASTYGMHFAISSRDGLNLPAAADVPLRYASATRPSPFASGPSGPASPSPSGGH